MDNHTATQHEFTRRCLRLFSEDIPPVKRQKLEEDLPVFAEGINHFGGYDLDKQIAALTAERDDLQEKLIAALADCVRMKDDLSQALSNGLNPYLQTEAAALTAERDGLRAALAKTVKGLDSLVKAWRNEADGHYCQTYNTGQAKGLNVAANMLEDYLKDARRALRQAQDETLEGSDNG